jgi:histidine triad (HIT) family protein
MTEDGSADPKANEECKFCKIGKGGLLGELPSTKEEEKAIHCNRGIYEDEYCIATLAPQQYTEGHTLLILKNHRAGITDDDTSKEELMGFINAIEKVSKHLKKNARNEDGKEPLRIYVGCLCEDIEHLHVHLIPRYQSFEKDINTFRERYKYQLSQEKIDELIEKDKIGGWWLIGECEKDYTKSKLWKKSNEERAKEFENRAEELRLSLVETYPKPKK